MPFLYQIEIKKSKIEGKGVFALENIPKGAVYWVFESPNEPLSVQGFEVKENRVHTQFELESIQDEQELKNILHGGFYYAEANLFIQFRDGTQFTNHSANQNGQIVYDIRKDYKKMKCVAKNEIKAGDQITEHYGNYLSSQAEWIDSLMTKRLPTRSAFEAQILKLKSGNNVNS